MRAALAVAAALGSIAVASGCGSADTTTIDALDKALPNFAGTLVVAKDGKAVFTKGDRDAEYNIASVGKTFTGVAVAQLAEAGKLRFGDHISRFAPELPRPLGRLTIRQLLTHTSGLGDFFSDPRYPELSSHLSTVESYLPLVVDERPAFRPGAHFLYSNSGYILLGLVVERASGEDYFDYVRDHVFRPAGMDNTELRPGLGSPAGGARSTAPDLLKFANALFAHRLLSARMTRTVTTAKVAAPGGGYGYGFGIRNGRHGDPPTVWHNGGAPGVGAELDMNPRRGWTVVVLAHRSYPEIAPAIDLVLNTLRIP
jgi:CubicO group peptidase (beta-lactamase class C family)